MVSAEKKTKDNNEEEAANDYSEKNSQYNSSLEVFFYEKISFFALIFLSH